MTHPHHPNRRQSLHALLGLGVAVATPGWAQSPRASANARALTVAQVVDMSTAQVDVSKDFVVGSRTAWQEINAKGGVQGSPVKHLVIEVDGSVAGLRTALESLKSEPHVVAVFGTAGDRTATLFATALRRELPDMPHVAPWLHNVDAVASTNTFPIFASRQEQIAHAIKSLSVMGITQVGTVYGSAAEFAVYRRDLEHIARSLKLAVTPYYTEGDLRDLAQTLTPESPRVLLFVGGTPELVRFAQGVEKQAAQRYLIAMSDVNLQSIQQLGASRFTPMIATQVVPMVNSSLPLVKGYRVALGRLFDEPPTPLSLAGYVSARYTFEVLHGIDGPVTRQTALQAFGRRSTIDLGGFRIAPDARYQGTAFVTQSMVAADGRLVG